MTEHAKPAQTKAKEQALFNAIHDYILTSAREGRRLDTETELARRFNVTRYRVRKALSVLTQMGVIDRAPKRGMSVNSVEPKNISDRIQGQLHIANFDVREFIEARLLIEVDIIPLAMRRMTPAMLGRLENAIFQIEANAHNTREADRWDREFHLLLLEACGNRVLQVFSGVLVTYFDKTTEKLPSFDPNFFMDIARKERDLLTAMKKGDEKRAQQLLRSQLNEQIILLA